MDVGSCCFWEHWGETELLLKGGVVMMFEYPLYVYMYDIIVSELLDVKQVILVKFGQMWARLFDTELWPGWTVQATWWN